MIPPSCGHRRENRENPCGHLACIARHFLRDSVPVSGEVRRMGFDCTFHVVDEQAIREEFVPKLLGRSRKKTPLDRVMDNAADLWAQVRRALAEGVGEGGENLGGYDVAALGVLLPGGEHACSSPAR